MAQGGGLRSRLYGHLLPSTELAPDDPAPEVEKFAIV